MHQCPSLQRRGLYKLITFNVIQTFQLKVILSMSHQSSFPYRNNRRHHHQSIGLRQWYAKGTACTRRHTHTHTHNSTEIDYAFDHYCTFTVPLYVIYNRTISFHYLHTCSQCINSIVLLHNVCSRYIIGVLHTSIRQGRVKKKFHFQTISFNLNLY